MYELPPILSGTEREQLAALRAYLVRMARELDETVEKSVETTVESAVRSAVQTASGASAAAAPEGTKALRSLIVKTADTIRRSVETIETRLREDYLAVSDFGSYCETLERTITETARLTTESFEAEMAILGGRQDEAEAHMQALRGEIRRGLITDPETGETAMGIAISEELRFTGQTQTQNGLVYYELSPGQTLGLYTSTGWQFWIGGSKRGWFSSVDGNLHAARLAVEQSLTLGAGWVITAADGFGLRYAGT